MKIHAKLLKAEATLDALIVEVFATSTNVSNVFSFTKVSAFESSYVKVHNTDTARPRVLSSGDIANSTSSSIAPPSS